MTLTTTLEDYYREKVWVHLLRYLHCCLTFSSSVLRLRSLPPEFDEYVSSMVYEVPESYISLFLTLGNGCGPKS